MRSGRRSGGGDVRNIGGGGSGSDWGGSGSDWVWDWHATVVQRPSTGRIPHRVRQRRRWLGRDLRPLLCQAGPLCDWLELGAECRNMDGILYAGTTEGCSIYCCVPNYGRPKHEPKTHCR